MNFCLNSTNYWLLCILVHNFSCFPLSFAFVPLFFLFFMFIKFLELSFHLLGSIHEPQKIEALLAIFEWKLLKLIFHLCYFVVECFLFNLHLHFSCIPWFIMFMPCSYFVLSFPTIQTLPTPSNLIHGHTNHPTSCSLKPWPTIALQQATKLPKPSPHLPPTHSSFPSKLTDPLFTPK